MAFRGHRINWMSWVSPSTMLVLGVELRSSGLVRAPTSAESPCRPHKSLLAEPSLHIHQGDPAPAMVRRAKMCVSQAHRLIYEKHPVGADVTPSIPFFALCTWASFLPWQEAVFLSLSCLSL